MRGRCIVRLSILRHSRFTQKITPMKTPNENKWIAAILISATAISAIIVIEGKPKTLPKRETNNTIHILPKVGEMTFNPSPLSF